MIKYSIIETDAEFDELPPSVQKEIIRAYERKWWKRVLWDESFVIVTFVPLSLIMGFIIGLVVTSALGGSQ